MSDAQNEIDMLTTGIMAEKAEAAAKLTPVQAEMPALPTPAQIMQEVDAAYILRTIDSTEHNIGALFHILRTEVRKALRAQAVQDPATVLDEGAAIAAARQVFGDDLVEVDPKFAADFADKTAAAKAATFRAPQVAAPGAPAAQPGPDGWSCPEHGTESLTTLTSAKGRVYLACTMCGKYQK